MPQKPIWGVAVIMAATFALSRVATPVSPVAAPRLEDLPMSFPAWVARTAAPLAPDVARTLGTDQYVHRYYRGPAGTIEMDVAYYGQPRVGANMHSPLNCLPGTGWAISDAGVREIGTATGVWTVREITVHRGSTRFAMTYWFQSRLRVIDDEVAVRFHLLGDALRRRPGDAALVRVMMPTRDSRAGDRDTLASFAAEVIPALDAALQ